MSDVMRCLVVTAENAPLARSLAAGLSSGGNGMFTTALSATGLLPATHYVSSGWINRDISELLSSAEALYTACVAAGASVTLAMCEKLVSESVVSIEDAFSVFGRLELRLVN